MQATTPLESRKEEGKSPLLFCYQPILRITSARTSALVTATTAVGILRIAVSTAAATTWVISATDIAAIAIAVCYIITWTTRSAVIICSANITAASAATTAATTTITAAASAITICTCFFCLRANNRHRDIIKIGISCASVTMASSKTSHKK